MKHEFLIKKFGDRLICLRGVGKLFYQDGFPISFSIRKLKELGIEVSLYHVADECLKHGWSPKTIINRLRDDFEDDIDTINYDLSLVEKFCNSEYDEQRDIIFEYLYNINPKYIKYQT